MAVSQDPGFMPIGTRHRGEEPIRTKRMDSYMRIQTLLGLITLMSFALMGCGPTTASPPSGAVAAQADNSTPTVAPGEPDPQATTAITPTVTTPQPTKPPLPDGPRPTVTPIPVPPMGLEDCKSLGTLRDNVNFMYLDWCGDHLGWHIQETCEPLATSDLQHQCGRDIVSEYPGFRHGPVQCSGISKEGPRTDCIREGMANLHKNTILGREARAKVKIAGDRDPAVVQAMKDTIACLEEKGFKIADPDRVLYWQNTDPIEKFVAYEESLSPEDKELRTSMRQPTQDCAKQHRLFEAQKAAWANELRRLDKDEPELAAVLIADGMLEALEKPGTPTFINGEKPPFIPADR